MSFQKSVDGDLRCVSLLAIAAAAVLLRLAYVLYSTGKPIKASDRVRTLIVLGSGGHTAEMLSIINVIHKDRFAPRVYVAATTDNMSLQKARALEEALEGLHRVSETPLWLILLGSKGRVFFSDEIWSLGSSEKSSGRKTEVAQYMQIYRSREVGQSYLTSIGTTMIAMAHALWLTLKIRPQVVVCNGPGTCLPLCIAAFLFKAAGLRWPSIFYIESIARVRRLSLSGLLLYKLHMVDQFFVQWPQLQKAYPRAHYVGRLM